MGSSREAGITPTIVCMVESILTDWPITFGSPPKWRFQKALLRITSWSRWASSA
jgi:hypothetical protein